MIITCYLWIANFLSACASCCEQESIARLKAAWSEAAKSNPESVNIGQWSFFSCTPLYAIGSYEPLQIRTGSYGAGHRVILILEGQSSVVFFKVLPFADLFWLTALRVHVRLHCIRWCEKKGWKYFCRVVFVCFSLHSFIQINFIRRIELYTCVSYVL